jgi:hypothetical protein
MRDASPQPSQIVFPVALEPAQYVPEPVAVASDRWAWLELFVLVQVFWGVLLFVPGSQAYRTYIRAFPYVTSLMALGGCARSNGADAVVPGARWIIAALVLLVANLVHEETWLTAGVAQVVFQLAIAAPVFWAARMWVTAQRLERLIVLIFAANFVSAALGLLQVYYPSTFLPAEFSSLASKINPEFVSSMSYVGSAGRIIIRPSGLSDLPGGAAIAGAFTALLGFALAMRTHQRQVLRMVFFAAAAIGVTVVYLTQVRSMLLMILGCMLIMALVRLRQGRILQTGWLAASAGVLVFGSFLWAVTLGGDVVQDRYQGMVDSGVLRTYQDNRGFILTDTISRLAFDYPLGAGLGRWGMMSLYFGDQGNWQYPALYAEIQPTGWIYDGGVLMWLFYPGALLLAIRYSYKLATYPGGSLNDLGTMVLSIQLLLAGLCFTGPVFNTQLGIMFWLATAILYGCQRTQAVQAWMEDAEEDDAGADGADEEFSAAHA